MNDGEYEQLEDDLEDTVMENVKLRKRIEELEDALTASINSTHFYAIKEILERRSGQKP